jgi:hypothetical protein
VTSGAHSRSQPEFGVVNDRKLIHIILVHSPRVFQIATAKILFLNQPTLDNYWQVKVNLG